MQVEGERAANAQSRFNELRMHLIRLAILRNREAMQSLANEQRDNLRERSRDIADISTTARKRAASDSSEG